MYLSRVILDKDVGFSLNRIHGAIERCVQGFKLWRLDNNYLLILSEHNPDLTSLCGQFSKNSWETKTYDPKLEKDSTWHFRLVANPTVSEWRDEGRGHVKACSTEEDQRKWLDRQSEKYGFHVYIFHRPQSTWFRFKKKDGNVVTFLAVAFEGDLIITDVEKMRTALTHGIGRSKAYGMGMMTLAP